MVDPTHRLSTAASVAALAPRATRYAVPDSKVTGLEMRVSPDGTKVWALRYRARGQQRRLKLGAYPRLGLADARLRASRELRNVDHGLDPQAERRAATAALEAAKQDSIDALVVSYIERWAKPRKRTWRTDASRLRREVLPHWRGRPVTSITRRDVRALIQAIADRGAPILANRVLEIIRKMFNVALMNELITVNPAALVPKAALEARQRPEGEREAKAYSAEEVRRIWQNTEPLPVGVKAPIRLQILTGQRPGECSDLAWSEIDGAWWTIPAARSKNKQAHRVYLTSAALDVLAEVPRLDDEPRAFRGARGNRQRTTANVAIFDGVTPRTKPRHTLRDTVATGLAACGVAIEDIAKVLNHMYGPRVTAGYNAYAYDKEKRLALSRWARRLAAILEQTDAHTVVAIERRA